MNYWGEQVGIWVAKHVAGLIVDLSLDAIWWNLGLFSHKHNNIKQC